MVMITQIKSVMMLIMLAVVMVLMVVNGTYYKMMSVVMVMT
jgi:hypothetical protein